MPASRAKPFNSDVLAPLQRMQSEGVGVAHSRQNARPHERHGIFAADQGQPAGDALVPMVLASVHEDGAGRFLQRFGQGPIFITIGAANRRDALQVIFGLIAIAPLDLPEAVVVPGQHMVRI